MVPSVQTIVEKALAGESLSAGDACCLIHCDERELDFLFEAAGALRDRLKGRIVTYSRKIFLPITNLCRDRCAYCTFRKDPSDPGAWTMSPDEVAHALGLAKERGCKEALMCLGDRPELAFPQYREMLAGFGHRTTAEYLSRACEMAIARGLLPHTNAGVLSYNEMTLLKPVNGSLGLMLENVSPRLSLKGMPHFSAPDKNPALRLRMLREAGELSIAFTTGILIGIGETLEERVDSLFAIKELHERYGHIQEVIIQNFRAKPGIAMADSPEPSLLDMVQTIAVARLILGGRLNIQAPPNLTPDAYQMYLFAGINDWGGISPVTRDYINPEKPWPKIVELRETTAAAGFELRERLAIYPEYVVQRNGFIPRALSERIYEMADEEGLVKREAQAV